MLYLLDKIIIEIYFFELSCTNAINWLSDSYTRHNTPIPKQIHNGMELQVLATCGSLHTAHRQWAQKAPSSL